MIDFNRKPSPKSEKEQEFDRLNQEYTEKFGVPYVFSIGADGSSWDETLEDIRQRIKDGNKQPEPDYEPGDDY